MTGQVVTHEVGRRVDTERMDDRDSCAPSGGIRLEKLEVQLTLSASCAMN
jgi:hypothetical protein